MNADNRKLLVNDGITSFRDFADIAENLMVLELKEKLLAGWSTTRFERETEHPIEQVAFCRELSQWSYQLKVAAPFCKEVP